MLDAAPSGAPGRRDLHEGVEASILPSFPAPTGGTEPDSGMRGGALGIRHKSTLVVRFGSEEDCPRRSE